MDDVNVHVSVDREFAGFSLKAGEDNYVPVNVARNLVASRKAVYAEKDEPETQPDDAPVTPTPVGRPKTYSDRIDN